MFGYNYVNLIGNLTKDCEVRKTKTGLSVCDFTVAVNKRMKTSDGSWDEIKTFVRCQAWRSTADFLGVYGKKGSLLQVVGELRDASWTDQSDVRHDLMKVEASAVNLLERVRREDRQERQAPDVSVWETFEVGDEDLPF